MKCDKPGEKIITQGLKHILRTWDFWSFLFFAFHKPKEKAWWPGQMRIKKLENQTVCYSRDGLHTSYFNVQSGVTKQSQRCRRKSCAGHTFDSLFQKRKTPTRVRKTVRAAGHMSQYDPDHEQRVQVGSLYCRDIRNAYVLQPWWAGFVILHLRAGHPISGSHLSFLSSQWMEADTSSLWFIRPIFDVNLWMQWLSL